SAPANRPLKIAVVDTLPASGKQYGDRTGYTTALHRFLGMGNGILIIVTRKGVSVSTNALPPDQITQITRQTAPQILRDPVGGIRQTVEALNASIDHQGGAAASTTPPGQGTPGPSSGQIAPTPPVQPQETGGLGDYWWLL